MQVTILHILSLLGLLMPYMGGVASAITTSTISRCLTVRGQSSVADPPTSTKVYSTTLTDTATVTSTPTATITPKAVTTRTTKTLTSTMTVIEKTETDSFTTTITVGTTTTTTVRTSTITSKVFESTTTTVTASGTTTVPTLPGFLPVETTLPNSSQKRRQTREERNAAKRRSISSPELLFGRSDKSSSPIGGGNLTSIRYVAAVYCVEVLEGIVMTTTTITGTSTTTVIAATPTITITATVTSTVSSTLLPPDASTTITTTTTSTSTVSATATTTHTTTKTVTNTVKTYSATYYAACAPTNIVGTVQGDAILETWGPGGSVYAFTSDTSAYECCVTCFLNPTCLGSAFYAKFSTDQQCGNFDGPNNFCSAQGEYALDVSLDTQKTLGPNAGFLVSNGNCGSYQGVNN